LRKSLVKRLVERILRIRGYDLHLIGTPLRGFENFLSLVKTRGFLPNVVIDIGVGNGTPWLCEAFPDSKFIMFEALKIFEDDIRAICQKYDAEYHICALGEQEGEAAFHVPENVPTGSSLLPRTESRKEKVAGTRNESLRETTVEVKRLDGFKLGSPPFLMKIDVEGAELGVLRGAIQTLKQTEIVVCEVSVEKRHAGQADLSEVFSFMKSQHFQLFDIVEMDAQRDGPLSYLDAAFVKDTSKIFDTR